MTFIADHQGKCTCYNWGAEGWGVWMEPGHYLSCMKVTITFTFFCLPQTVKDISIFISYQQSIFRIPWYKMLCNYSFSEQLYQKSVKRKNLVFSQQYLCQLSLQTILLSKNVLSFLQTDVFMSQIPPIINKQYHFVHSGHCSGMFTSSASSSISTLAALCISTRISAILFFSSSPENGTNSYLPLHSVLLSKISFSFRMNNTT